jgi:CPA1 family monovalent cation:H+ antiporter
VLRHQQKRADQLTGRMESWVDSFTARGPRPGEEQRFDRAARALQRRQADINFYASEGLGSRGGAVLAWSGMRGVVTLAAAQSLPTDVPHRAELILIAFTVAILTLVVQGGSLPLVIRWLGIRGNDEEHSRREYARLAGELVTAAQALLESPTLVRDNGKPFDDEVLAKARERSLVIGEVIDRMVNERDPDSRLQQQRELQRVMVEAQQSALLDARAGGTFSSHTLERAQVFIDSVSARFTA